MTEQQQQQQGKIMVSPVEVLIMAVQLANSRGVFALNESSIISEAVNTILNGNNTSDKPISREPSELERLIISAHNNKKNQEEQNQANKQSEEEN